MKPITSDSYSLAEQLGKNALQLPKEKTIYTSPYTEKPLITVDIDKAAELTMFKIDDIAFVNTADFSRTGQHFLRTGKYTNLHPIYDKKEYQEFWDEEERRCKEGMVLPGKLYKDDRGNYKLQEVHITGEHYGYLNFGEIKKSKDFDVKKGGVYSPNGELLFTTENGGHSKSFGLPNFWDGDYYFYKAVELCRRVSRHLAVGKARRKGYSYKNAWLVANRANLYRRSTSVIGAYDKASLFDDGTMNKVLNHLDNINKYTDWSKRRLHNTLEHIEIGFRYKGDETKRGFLSNIYTAVLKTNPGAMRGKDADLLLIEEAGKCPNLSEVLDATLKSLEDGEFITGLMIVFGTGGGESRYWQAFEDLFYESYKRNFIMFENIWDNDMIGNSCSYFHPQYMNKPGSIDEYGNSNIRRAIEVEEKIKLRMKNSPAKIIAHEMEEPDKPSQAFSRSNSNIFPSNELDLQLKRCLFDPQYKNIGREGIFVQDTKGIIFMDRASSPASQKDLIPNAINNFPLLPEDNDLRGCFTLWEQPYRDSNGRIPDNLYHLWYDPFGISKVKEEFTTNDSLGSCYIYEASNNFTPTRGDRIIGAYHGRTESTEEFDLQVFLATQYYNAKLLYENDRGDVFINAKKHGFLHLLKEEPEFHYQKDLQKGGLGRKRGISIGGNSLRKTNGLLYINDWLIEKRGFGINNTNLLNLHYIYDIGLLRELIKFKNKGNYDRISALIIGMYDIKETTHKAIIPKVNKSVISSDSYFTDPFNA